MQHAASHSLKENAISLKVPEKDLVGGNADMEFLKECRKISLLYGSINFKDMEKQTEIRENHCEYVTAYTLPDGLKITNIAKKYDKYGAYEWVTYFENTGDADTQVITELYDCDADFAFEQDKRPESRAIVPDSSAAKIFSPKGSAWTNDEFCCNPEEVAPGGQKPYYIFPDDIKEYSTDGGRSSQSKAPFFDINRQDKGVIFAIGWTGQWKCSISRNDTHINVKTKIEDTCFKLYPGEKIRTSSIVIMPYGNGQINAHNKWRRLVREHFSVTGREGRGQRGPF